MGVADVDGLFASRGIDRLRKPLNILQQKARHGPAHGTGPSRCRHKQIIGVIVQQFGVQLQKGIHLSVPDGQYRFVIVGHVKGLSSRHVHVLCDAPGHAAQELLGLGHGLLLTLPLLQQRADDDLFLLQTQMHHSAACVLLAIDPHIPGVSGMIPVDRLGDGGGGEEHPVQIVAVLAQGLADDEAAGDALFLLFIVPFEVHIYINSFAPAVVNGAEQVGLLGDLPAILPLRAKIEILIGQIAHAFQPVLQFLEHLLARALACVFHHMGLCFGGFPPLQFDYFHPFLHSFTEIIRGGSV